MPPQINDWLHTAINIPAEFSGKLLSSLVVIVLLLLIRTLILKAVWRRTEVFQIRYHWRKISNYVAFFLAILFLGRVWFKEFQSVATFLGLLSAGLAIALRDPIVNLAGWLFILWRRPFIVGDRIQIGIHAGDVIDARIFQFTLMEIGGWVAADQSTGRIIHVPNSKVFTEPQINYTEGWFDYIWNEIPVLMTFESNWKIAKEILGEIAERHAGHLVSPAQFKMKESSRQFMIFSPNLAPSVFTSVAESGVLLTMRYLCDPRRRRDSTAEIWEEVLEKFSQRDDVDFAYPTRRFFDNKWEGKPGHRETTPPRTEDAAEEWRNGST
ncbi:MAG: mechanosensitive ion channel family protein [Geobacteraceae bacterium]|nr:mechanosensitive ion channel family protein [Geobacteraceae bacterium]